MIQKFISWFDATINMREKWAPEIKHVVSMFIMDVFISHFVPPEETHHLNKWNLYMHAMTLFDMTQNVGHIIFKWDLAVSRGICYHIWRPSELLPNTKTLLEHAMD